MGPAKRPGCAALKRKVAGLCPLVELCMSMESPWPGFMEMVAPLAKRGGVLVRTLQTGVRLYAAVMRMTSEGLFGIRLVDGFILCCELGRGCMEVVVGYVVVICSGVIDVSTRHMSWGIMFLKKNLCSGLRGSLGCDVPVQRDATSIAHDAIGRWLWL